MYLMYLYNHHGNIYDCQLLSQIFVELVRFLRLVWSHASPAPGDTSSLCLASPSATNVQNRSAIPSPYSLFLVSSSATNVKNRSAIPHPYSLFLVSPSATNVQNRSAIHPWILPASSCPLLLLQMFRRGQLSPPPPWLGLDTFHRMLTQFLS